MLEEGGAGGPGGPGGGPFPPFGSPPGGGGSGPLLVGSVISIPSIHIDSCIDGYLTMCIVEWHEVTLKML